MPRNFIQSAIKHRGLLRAEAENQGAITKAGTISVRWLLANKHDPGSFGKRVRLALTLRELRKRKIHKAY